MRILSLGMILGLFWGVAFSAPSFSDQAFGGGALNPGDDRIVAQVIQIQGDSAQDATIEFVHIRNAGTATSTDLAQLYLAWEQSAPILPTSEPPTSTPLMSVSLSGKNLQTGVIVSTAFFIPRGATRYLWILAKVAGVASVEDGKTVAFETNLYWYTARDAGNSGFLADRKPETIRKAGFEEVLDESPESNFLNPGDTAPVQKFRIRDLDANDHGLSIEKITVKRASDATARSADLEKIKLTISHGIATYFAKKTPDNWDTTGAVFTKDELGLTGVTFPDGAQLTVLVEIEVKAVDEANPVEGRTLRNQLIIETQENDQTTTWTITSPTTWKIRRAGPEEAEEISTLPPGPGINPGERLTQKVWVADRDYNGNKFQITHIWIKNLGTAETTDIAGLTIWMGTTQVCSGWPRDFDIRSGGWIPVTSRIVNDEGEATITIEYRISPLAITDRTLRPEVRVGTSEPPPIVSPGATPTYATPHLLYPEAVTLYPAGFEIMENIPIDPATVYSTQRFVAQKIKLEDRDANTHGVILNRVQVKNIGTAANTQFTKLEVRLAGADGALLGETTNLSEFHTGIAVTPTANNTVADDSSVEIWIWLTLADPDKTLPDHTVCLETSFSFAEGTVHGDTSAIRGTSFTIAINHPPVVQDFTWSPINPQYGQEVTFTPGTITDPDGDQIVYSKWDFGEGADPRYVAWNGPPQAAKTTYPEGGTFNVTLLVRDAKGLEGSKTKQISVTPRPNQPPSVDFSWSPERPTVGQAVTFTSTVTDPDNDTPFTYAWRFGDGGTSTEANPTHTYTAAGTYTVRLEVTDRRGAKGSKEKTITVIGAPPPTVTSLSADPTSPEVDTEVTFTARATTPQEAPVTRWKFDFGDGTTQELENRATTVTITHTYASPGSYTVQVQAQNASGWSTPKTLTIYVRPKGAVLWLQILDNPAQTQCRLQIVASPTATDLKLYILDQAGRLVLERGVNTGTFTWDLRDQNGRNVPNGLYLVFLTAKVADRIERTEIGRVLVRR